MAAAADSVLGRPRWRSPQCLDVKAAPANPPTMRVNAVLALAACLGPAAAIFEDDAYHIDFHYALIGAPKQDATFFQKPYAGSKASLLYTLSHNQTVGAVNPKDGALVWRQAPPAGSQGRGALRAGEDQDTVVSAVGDHITAWSASDGRIVWEHRADGAIVEDLEILEQEDGIPNAETKDTIVLLGGNTQGVRRLDGKTGRVKWTHQDTRYAEHHNMKSFSSASNIMQQWRYAVSGLNVADRNLLHLTPHAITRRIYEAASDIPQPDHGQAARPVHAELGTAGSGGHSVCGCKYGSSFTRLDRQGKEGLEGQYHW